MSSWASSSLPDGLTLEDPGSNLASLSMTDSLKTLIDIVIRQWQSQEVFKPLAKHGIFPIRQLLFFGPPGNGKTTACQWIGQRLGVPLYRVRCEQLVGKYLGATAANVGNIMEWLQKSPSSVILFDEVESLFPSRTAYENTFSREMSSAMAVYWQALDRWKKNHLFVLATNMHEKLDPALVSRIELHLEFGPPTESQAREVVSYWSEVLHDYGASEWSALLNEQIESGFEFASFRDLWQAIQRHVTNHVTKGLTKNGEAA